MRGERAVKREEGEEREKGGGERETGGREEQVRGGPSVTSALAQLLSTASAALATHTWFSLVS